MRITWTGRVQPAGARSAAEAGTRLIAIDGPCGGCAAPCLGRSEARIPRLADQALAQLAAPAPAGENLAGAAGIEQALRLSVEGRGLTAVAWMIFGVPVVALLAGAVIGEHLAAEQGSLVLGYSALLAAAAAVRPFAPHLVRWLQLRVEPD